MRTFVFTTAERAYDYDGTVQLSPFVGRADMKPVRLVSVIDALYEHQIGRYRSGMHPIWDETKWRAMCAEIPTSYEHFEPVTEDFNLLTPNVQYRIAEVDNQDGTALPVADKMVDTLLIAMGVFRRVTGGVVMRMKIEDIHQRNEDGQFWEILKSGDKR